ncbi:MULTISPECIES: AAA family ATPase [unclassified Nitrospina]|uniref:cytidylate kinase-like family protein n=1 Tax=unclassified Nitrospina TaxID=2638683 RepID=UPI003F9E8824
MSATLPESIAEKIIEDKIQEWEAKKRGRSGKEPGIGAYPFIAISRDYGCLEEKLIPLFEKKFQWKVYGRNLLDHIASRDALNRSFIETLDEHHANQLDQWIHYLISSGALRPDEYLVKLSKLMKVIVTHEAAIFVGRGAHYILADKPHGVFVKLTAPFAYRAEHIARLKNISQTEAETLVRRIDRERQEFIQHHFKQDIEDASHFDLSLNTRTIPADMVCQLVGRVMEIKTSTVW